MIGFLIALGLGFCGKWRWLGYAALFDMLVFGTSGLVRGDSAIGLLSVPVLSVLGTGIGYGAGAFWQRMVRGAWPRDRALGKLVTIRRGLDAEGGEILFWEIESAALTTQVARVFVVVLALVFVLVTLIFGVIRGGAFAEAAVMAAIGCGAVAALFVLVIFGILFNRIRRTYVLAESFYAVVLTDPRLFAGILGSGAAGVVGAQPIPAGAALAAAARRGERHDWDSVRDARYCPDRGCIEIRLKKAGWLGRDTIFCHADSFAAACAWVSRHLGRAAAPIKGCSGGQVEI